MPEPTRPDMARRPDSPQPRNPQEPTVRRALSLGVKAVGYIDRLGVRAVRAVGDYIDRTYVRFDQEVKPKDMTLPMVADRIHKTITHPNRLKPNPRDYRFDDDALLFMLGHNGRHSEPARYTARVRLRELASMEILEEGRNEEKGNFEYRLAPGKLDELQQEADKLKSPQR